MDTCHEEWLRFLDAALATTTLAINVWQSQKIKENDSFKSEARKIVRSLTEQMERLSE